MATTPSRLRRPLRTTLCMVCHHQFNPCHQSYPCHRNYICYVRRMSMSVIPKEDPTPNVPSYNLSVDLHKKVPFAGQNRFISYWILFEYLNFGYTNHSTVSRVLRIVLSTGHQHVEFIQIVEGHLMAIPTEYDLLISNHDCTMAITSAWALSNNDISLIYQWLHELWIGSLSKLR
jgi:hypothetical protein